MIDRKQLRETIAAAPAHGCAAQVTRAWLEEVERTIDLGQEAMAELERLRQSKGRERTRRARP